MQQQNHPKTPTVVNKHQKKHTDKLVSEPLWKYMAMCVLLDL